MGSRGDVSEGLCVVLVRALLASESSPFEGRRGGVSEGLYGVLLRGLLESKSRPFWGPLGSVLESLYGRLMTTYIREAIFLIFAIFRC